MILNLTQHAATQEQVAAGVVEPSNKTEVQSLLTFDTLPSGEEVLDRAEKLAAIAASQTPVGSDIMIGGAPYLMAPLEAEILKTERFPVYSFSVRKSFETTLPDGSVKKTAVFTHAGFVLAATVGLTD